MKSKSIIKYNASNANLSRTLKAIYAFFAISGLAVTLLTFIGYFNGSFNFKGAEHTGIIMVIMLIVIGVSCMLMLGKRLFK